MRPIREFSLRDERRRMARERKTKRKERMQREQQHHDVRGTDEDVSFARRLERGFGMMGDE